MKKNILPLVLLFCIFGTIQVKAYELKITNFEVNDFYTVVEYMYTGDRVGNRINIEKSVYIKSIQSGKIYRFIKVDGIPTAPDRYYTKTMNEVIKFRLYFEKINEFINDASVIDIIECSSDGLTSTCFNFYGVKPSLPPFYGIKPLVVAPPKPSANIDVIGALRLLVGPSSSSSSSSSNSSSDCGFKELEDVEKQVCDLKITTRRVECKSGRWEYLFWAEKNTSGLECIESRFDSDYERGWFYFEGNWISANKAYFLTNDRSFDKAAKIACSCEQK